MPTQWTTIGLNYLEREVMAARESCQHLFIWDKTGRVPAFFEIFGGLHVEFTNCMVDVALTREDQEVDNVRTVGLQHLRK